MRLLFAPGAGAPSSSAWMRAWKKRLAAFGRVTSFDYPYQREGRARPDPPATLIAAHRAALARLEPPVVLCGKSMGGRIGCHVALEETVSALVCFGYPLIGQTGKKRDQVLLDLRTPILFIQGTRDPMCPLAELAAVRKRMRAPTELHVVDSGDHSLLATKTWLREHHTTQRQVDDAMAAAIAAFLGSHR